MDYIRISSLELIADEIYRKGVTGSVAELGVYKGDSLNWWMTNVKDQNSRFYGFDSFEGNPEDWSGWNAPRGTFNRDGRLPRVPDNVQLVKGWFNVTLPAFVSGLRAIFEKRA